MKLIIYLLIISLVIGCVHNNYDITNNRNKYNNRNNLNELIDAYIFLSNNHDLLHIMMGEYKGSAIESYKNYKNKIEPLKNNLYLQPILFSDTSLKTKVFK